uniref:SHSP domain-containing protein n=1 Tax=Oryza meridionalis TaxID=40149 RepID=A0A0E0C3Z0_9ORYZ
MSAVAAEVEHRDGGDLREQVWLDGAAAGYVVRLDIAGFSKEEIDVRVNGATGRVTVLGQRPAGAAAEAASAGHVRLRRVI